MASNELIETDPIYDDSFEDVEDDAPQNAHANIAPLVPFDIDENDIVENTNALGYDSNGRPRVSSERKLMIERNAKRRKRRPIVDPNELYYSHRRTATHSSSAEIDYDDHRSLKTEWWSSRPALVPEIDIVRHKNGRLDLSSFTLPTKWKANKWINSNVTPGGGNSSGSMMFGTFVNAALCNDDYMKSYILNMLAFWHPLSAWWSSTSLENEVHSKWDSQTRVMVVEKERKNTSIDNANSAEVEHSSTIVQWMTRMLKKWIRLMVTKSCVNVNIGIPVVRRRIIMMMGPKIIFSDNVFGDESDEYNCLSSTPFGSWMCDDQNWMENLCNQSHLTPLSFMANFGRSVCIQLTQPQTRREDALDVGLILLLIYIVSTHSSHLFNTSESVANDASKNTKRLKSSKTLITRILRFRSFDLDDKDESDLGRTNVTDEGMMASSSSTSSGRMTPGGRITPSHRITKSQWIHDSMPIYRILTRTPVFVMLLIQCWRGAILTALSSNHESIGRADESASSHSSAMSLHLFECVCKALKIWEPVDSNASNVKGEGDFPHASNASSSSPPISYNTHCTRIVDWFDSACDYLLHYCNAIFPSATLDFSSYPSAAQPSSSQSVIDESLQRMIVTSSTTLAKLEQILSSSSLS